MADAARSHARKDARRNHDALVTAAEEAFATAGFAVPAEVIAARAGVSVATLYRHFPDRGALIDEVQARVYDEWNALLAQAREAGRAWDGLVKLFTGLGDRAAASPTFAELSRRLIERGYPGSDRWNAAWTELVGRAHAEGDLRHDVTATEVAVTMLAFVMAVAAFEPVQPVRRDRQIALMLDGLASPARRSPGDPGTPRAGGRSR